MAASVISERDGGLADPKDFLLDLGEPLIATFDGQIAPGDHDAESPDAHGSEHEFGQVLEGLSSFDLENQSQVLPTEFRKVLEQLRTSESVRTKE
jgi:hypothetical protein